ncbi:MAG: VWA domain-containing protein [Candidatus Helarchaeota archaeon]
MTQKDFDTEDTVICIDTSRSMARKDFQPNRLQAVKNAVITFVQKKHNIDKTDRFALVTFSTNAQIVQELTNDPELIINALQNLTPRGISSLGEGLAVALHVVSDQILKQGSNINRILVISDGKPWLGTVDPLEKSQIMGEVGIIVDTIELSAERAAWGHNILESIAILGDYHQVPNKNYLELTLETLSHKKDVYELKKTTPKLHLIAEYLLNPKDLTEGISDAIKQTKKVEEEHCVICRLEKCDICGTIDCGRICPYCKSYIHLCCAEKWAEESKMAEASVFRCPHCLFLLRLPEDIQSPESVEGKQESEESTLKIQRKNQEIPDTIGDFFLEHEQMKLVSRLREEEKTFYLSWEGWGSRDFRCNIMSGMNEIICKEFTPKINWLERTCSGFTLRDYIGWFSRPSLDRGVFLLELEQFENWCKIVLEDVEYIKDLLKQQSEITLESDKLIDFEFVVDVVYDPPINTTNRNKLDQQLLRDAIRYLKVLRNRPYSQISGSNILKIPKTPVKTVKIIATPEAQGKIDTYSTVIPADIGLPKMHADGKSQATAVNIENPYTGQKVEIPTAAPEGKYIGTARTLSLPKSVRPKKRAQGRPQLGKPEEPNKIRSKEEVAPILELPKKVKLRCNSCRQWFEMEKFGEYSCPNCHQPLKLAIQCDNCENWFSVSKPGKYTCPKCKVIIDATQI